MAAGSQSPAWGRGSSSGRSTAPLPPTGTLPPRMLRVEFKGQPYDWFNLDEMGELVRSEDFANTLRENIVHYFSVPYDCQAIFDEEGVLSTAADFARALKGQRPCIKVWDVREMPQDVREQAAQKLAVAAAEVARSQRILNAFPGRAGSRPVSPWPTRTGTQVEVEAVPVGPGGACPCPGALAHRLAAASPPREPRASFADRLAVGGTPPMPAPPMLPAGLLPPGPPPPFGMAARPMMPAGLVGPGMLPGAAGSWAPAAMGPAPPPMPMEPVAVMPGSAPGMRQFDVGLRPPWQEPALPMGKECIEVTLAKDPSDANSRFGFANVPSADGRHLLVTWVDANGLLGRWNRSYPDRGVREGDLICAVNSATEDVEAMRSQLQQEAVRMVIRRGTGLGGPPAA